MKHFLLLSEAGWEPLGTAFPPPRVIANPSSCRSLAELAPFLLTGCRLGRMTAFSNWHPRTITLPAFLRSKVEVTLFIDP